MFTELPQHVSFPSTQMLRNRLERAGLLKDSDTEQIYLRFVELVAGKSFDAASLYAHWLAANEGELHQAVSEGEAEYEMKNFDLLLRAFIPAYGVVCEAQLLLKNHLTAQ